MNGHADCHSGVDALERTSKQQAGHAGHAGQLWHEQHFVINPDSVFTNKK
jgi:hypothetical protein